MIIPIKQVIFVFFICFFSVITYANHPIFNIQLATGSAALPSHVGRYDPPTEHFFTITTEIPQ
jgi:hypothetical protein